MSEFDPIATTATAEAAAPASGAEVEGQGAHAAETPAAGGETTSEPRYVPQDRFNEVIQQRNELRARQEQYEPFAGVIQAAAELGITPEQFRSLLQQQAQAPPSPQADPQAQLLQYIEDHGQVPDYLTPEQLARWERNFQRDQQLDSFFANQQRDQVVVGFERGMTQVEAQFPVFKDNPELKEALLAATWAQDQTGRKMPQIAAAMNTALERTVNSRLAQYAVAKQQDGAFPVTAGGSSPAPVETVNFHTLSPSEQKRHLEQWDRAQSRDS